MPGLQLMDVTIRDGQQSLWASRMRIEDMLPILPKMDRVGYWAIEAWGGATFEACLRLLGEDPWERLRAIAAKTPNTRLAMLTRGQTLVGHRHYSQEIVHRFIAAAHRNGIDVFRVFDALNDIRNVADSAAAVRDAGAHFEGAIAYTVSPVHTLERYLEYGQGLKDLGAGSIAIKDMAGMLTPYRAERLAKAFKAEIGLPLHIHCHYAGGMAPANIIKAVESGADIVDTASAPLAFGDSHPAAEMVVAAFRGGAHDTGIDLDLLFEVAEYWEAVRERGGFPHGVPSLAHMQAFGRQVPGDMMSGLMAQLEAQDALDRLPEVMAEVSAVRAEVGYPPLITPVSRIVGMQALFNVLTGKRWSVASNEMKDYLCGYYGAAPGPVSQEVLEKVIGDAPRPDPDAVPGSPALASFDELAAEIGDLAESEEDVLTYALFPSEARAYLSRRHADGAGFLVQVEPGRTEEEDQVDITQIRELVRIAEQNGVGELVVEEEGTRVSVRMPGFAPAVPVPAPAAPAPAAPAAPVPAPAVPDAPDAGVPAGLHVVSSPMVGTFYVAPAPGERPFAVPGDEVEPGQTLCIVEAMKLMNEIPAEEAGIVRQVLPEDGEPVEFGTPLFYIEPRGPQDETGAESA